MDAIGTEADRLEARLMAAVRDDDYPPSNLPILQAAALEVAELDYQLVAGYAENVIWFHVKGQKGNLN